MAWWLCEELRGKGDAPGTYAGDGIRGEGDHPEEGEGVLFYSDGLVGAHSPHYEMFGFRAYVNS